AITTLAPTVSGRYSSRPAMSKEIDVTANSTSSCDRPGSRAIDVRKLTTAECVTSTPFGNPVEPDVYMTYASASLDTATAGDPAGAAAISPSSPFTWMAGVPVGTTEEST